MMITFSRDVLVCFANVEDIMSGIAEREPSFVLFLGKALAYWHHMVLMRAWSAHGLFAPLFGSGVGNNPALPWYF